MGLALRGQSLTGPAGIPPAKPPATVGAAEACPLVPGCWLRLRAPRKLSSSGGHDCSPPPQVGVCASREETGCLVCFSCPNVSGPFSLSPRPRPLRRPAQEVARAATSQETKEAPESL